ncbi:hypothetical protein [Vreelandella utahensis]|uniref:hypothetical protein n=1 Tax=Vreelandella halophila TaxID=86177 RepID=UPI0009879CD1|nr:hypothetical protein [Halomonas utahensis]
MTREGRLALAGLLLALAFPATAERTNSVRAFEGASYQACGLIASQYITSMQLMEQGLSPAILRDTLPGLSDAGSRRINQLHRALDEEGPAGTYSNIHARFARCARQVHEARGEPEPGTREDLFYRCAGENKIRYEIALAAFAGGTLEEVRGQLSPRHKPVAEALFKRYRETDAATVLRGIGTTFKACLRGPAARTGSDNG